MEKIFEENRALFRRIKQHIIAKEHDFFAIVQPGFEETSKRELQSIGIEKISNIIEGGIEFSGKIEDCHKVNVMCRTVNRVIMRVQKLRAEKFDVLKMKAEKIPWELYVNNKYPIAYNISSKKSILIHTGRIEEVVHSAIKNRLSEYHESIDYIENKTENPGQTVFIRNDNNKFQFSIDSTGELLYKRGSKTMVSVASLRETLAAQILYEAKIDKYDALIDPMCGAGTFSIEAAGILNKTLPSIDRKFAFMKWPCFKEKSYDFLKKKLCEKNSVNKDFKIYASDIDADNVEISQNNMKSSDMEKIISLNKRDFFQDIISHSEEDKKIIVLNPPYGTRLNTVNIKELYRKIGSTIRAHYRDCGYAIISPGLEMEKIMALPYDRKIKFFNGGIKVAVIIKDMY